MLNETKTLLYFVFDPFANRSAGGAVPDAYEPGV